MARIYVASSWRNPFQPDVVGTCRENGHLAYDFRAASSGFQWSDLDPDWQDWSGAQYREALKDPRASHGFVTDLRAMEWADTCVLLLPSGRSAHLEGGYMAGRGKRLIIYSPMEKRYRSARPISATRAMR